MKSIFVLIFTVSTLGSKALAAKEVLVPDTSIKCIAPINSDVSQFDFDLYFTGHEMGGLGSFSGLFEASTPGLVCATTRGHLKTQAIDGPKNVITYSATSNCLHAYQYTLRVNTTFYKQNETYDALLTYQQNGPFGPGELVKIHMSCQMRN